MATPAWRASAAPAASHHRGLSAFSRRRSGRFLDGQQMLERANYAFIERQEVGRSQDLQRSDRRQKGCKKVGAGALVGRKVAHQSVQLVRSTSTSSSGAAVRVCCWAGCNKYAPQKTAGLPDTELQKVPTLRNKSFNPHLFQF